MDNRLQETNFIIYKTKDGNVSVDVILKDETIWITQKEWPSYLSVLLITLVYI